MKFFPTVNLNYFVSFQFSVLYNIVVCAMYATLYWPIFAAISCDHVIGIVWGTVYIWVLIFTTLLQYSPCWINLVRVMKYLFLILQLFIVLPLYKNIIYKSIFSIITWGNTVLQGISSLSYLLIRQPFFKNKNRWVPWNVLTESKHCILILQRQDTLLFLQNLPQFGCLLILGVCFLFRSFKAIWHVLSCHTRKIHDKLPRQVSKVLVPKNKDVYKEPYQVWHVRALLRANKLR